MSNGDGGDGVPAPQRRPGGGRNIRVAELIRLLAQGYLEAANLVADYHSARHHEHLEQTVRLDALGGLEVPKGLFVTPSQFLMGPATQTLATELVLGDDGEIYATLRDDPDGSRTNLAIELKFEVGRGSEPMMRLHDKHALALDLGMQGLDRPAQDTDPEQAGDNG